MITAHRPHTQIFTELRKIQNKHGYLPDDALKQLSKRLGVTLYRLQAVASFFPHFRRQPPPTVEVRICRDMTCHMQKSCELIDKLKDATSEVSGQELSVEGVSCLGRCDRAPVGIVTTHDDHKERLYVDLSEQSLKEIVTETLQAVRHPESKQKPSEDSDRQWTARKPTDWEMDIYRTDDKKAADNAYKAVRRFVDNADPLSELDDEKNKSPEKYVADFDEINGKRGLDGDFSKERDEERQRLISALFKANLLGMGGAGARTYKKWFEVRKAKGDGKDVTRYIICNGDESEPGTFKDREILLRAPHLVVEGVILAGLYVGASKGFIYIRHEYAEQIVKVREEINRAKKHCDEQMQKKGYSFDVEVLVSPGGYICGEQTALIEAMENKRGEPRNRPPEIMTNGYMDMPTLLNNVETLAWVPAVYLKDDGKWFAGQGATDDYKGLRLISISGDIVTPGVYEIKIGTTLGELIDRADGMLDGQNLRAIAPSGPSGGFLPREFPISDCHRQQEFLECVGNPTEPTFDVLNLPIDINVTRHMYNGSIGAAIIVFGDQRDMLPEALSCSRFFRNESCGKCVPCRIGSQKLVEIGVEIGNKKYDQQRLSDLEKMIDELSETMSLTAICGLGTVASKPLASFKKYFRDEL